VFSQAAHHVDIVRRLAGRAGALRARRGRPLRRRAPVEGAYAALIRFEGGAFATCVYSGHAHFDSDAWMGWIGEMGQKRDPDAYGIARKRLATLARPATRRRSRRSRTTARRAVDRVGCASAGHHHFGPLIVSCDRADLRPLPTGVEICGDRERTFVPLAPPAVPRAEVIDELVAAVRGGAAPRHDGASALATVEICLAMLESARDGATSRFTRRPPPTREPTMSDTTRLDTDLEISRAILRRWHEDVPNDRLAHLVKDSVARVPALARGAARAARHPHGHWTFLRVLWERDGITQRELSIQAGVSEPATLAALRAMEKAGHVVRKRRAGNRKNVYVKLTRAGAALRRKLVPLAVTVNAVATRGVRAADVATTRRTLLTILDNLVVDELAQVVGAAPPPRAPARPRAPRQRAAREA
jgi:DNA-binding MarR family transcriptional regulator